MTTKKRAMPSGGKKGGAVLPRYDLDAAIAAAKRLVSKSHSAAVPRDIYFSGVLQVSGPRAEIKSSSLKQYGLLTGNAKSGFSASPLAKKIVNSEGAERTAAIREAALSPRVFKGIFDAFHGDIVTKSRLKQRASELNVHPDTLDACIKIYCESLSLAGLLRVDGDQVSHVANLDMQLEAADDGTRSPDNSIDRDSQTHEPKTESSTDAVPRLGKERVPVGAAKALINVTINLDSSLDTDKLEKQLALLKKFGAI